MAQNPVKESITTPAIMGEEGEKVIDWVTERINYARQLGGEKFVCTMQHENGSWDHTRLHEFSPPHYLCWNWESWEAKVAPNQAINKKNCVERKEGWFWRKHFDYGYGVSNGYNKLLFDDERFFTDWKWQMEKAVEIFKRNPYLFHAYKKYCEK